MHTNSTVRDDDPRLVGHPMVQKPNWKKRAVPLCIHGDGARFTQKGNKLLILSVSFLLADGWSWFSIFMMASICTANRCYEKVHGVDTMTVIWKYIVHAINALLDGFHPQLDPYGNPWLALSQQANNVGKAFANSLFVGVVWCLGHDMEYGSNELGLPQWGTDVLCTWCPASRRGDCSFADVSRKAGFKKLLFRPGKCD